MSGPIFEQEAQTLAHFFLEHPGDTLVAAPPEKIRGSYTFSAVFQGDSVSGTVELGDSPENPGSLQYGKKAAIPLVVVDTLDPDSTRIVGVGSRGFLNLWLTFTPEGFHGKWDWLGSTVEIHGTRRQETPEAGAAVGSSPVTPFNPY